MNEFPFDAAKAKAGTGPFPEEIENDKWMLFHGSSGQFLEAIAAEGLRTPEHLFSRAELTQLCSIFDRLNWAGHHGGGYAVLKPFSLDHDRAHSDQPSTYLAESSNRALLYASADWSGGEAARAVRHSVEDLRSRDDLLPIEKTLISVMERKAEATKAAHTFGVVYALLFGETSLSGLDYANPGMGVKALQRIPPTRIAGFVRVPGDWVQTVGPDKRRRERMFEDGIVSRLRELSQAQQVVRADGPRAARSARR
ncbi:MAG: hypothetical protein ACRD8U_07390 [Pyrinomonadaceae bacterium]